jgi:nitrite reductase/ring-hydroxylating ferredoxin subunit
MSTVWTPVFSADRVPAGKSRLFKKDGLQVAVFRVENGTLYAVDNRCPHEGYPLMQGTVDDCTLTCNWHNYKFDLRDGACVMGEEAVRSFPVRENDGQIEVDLSPPDPAEEQARLWESMDEGMHLHRMGQVARDVVRLIQSGVNPLDIAVYSAKWDALRAEYGTGHGSAVAADICRYLPRYQGAQAALPLVQSLDISSFPTRRMPVRERPAATNPGADPVAAGLRFRALVEAEDSAGAEGLIRGAIAAGWDKAIITSWLFRVVGDHFLSFGHRLIYLIKLLELLDLAGWEHADPILPALTFAIVNATREDRLPGWSSMNQSLGALENELPELYRGCTTQADPDWNGAGELTEVLLDGRRADVFAVLTRAIRDRAPLTAIVDVLSHTAALRMLRFNVAHDHDVNVQNNWLSVTHVQTFASAIRQAIQRVDDPCLIRMIFHSARFINNSKALDVEEQHRLDLGPTEHRGLEPLMAAITEGEPQAAVGMAAAWIQSGDDLSALQEALEDLAIQDPLTRPIVVAHVIKGTVVAFEEYAAMGDPMPVLALVRLLSSPIRERNTERLTREAIAFVTDGKVPRSLT